MMSDSMPEMKKGSKDIHQSNAYDEFKNLHELVLADIFTIKNKSFPVLVSASFFFVLQSSIFDL